MLQMFTVIVFECVKETPQFHEGFTESYNEESNEKYFLEVDVKYPEK